MGQRCGAVEIMGVKKMLRQIKGQFEKYTFGAAVKNILYHLITRERRKSFGGKNPNETNYIIRSINDKSPFYIGPVHNLLANYFYVLSHIQYAKTKGWIPVVDQLHYPVYNSQKEPINGTTNAWEYFWQQPGGISLEEAYQSKNVVLSKQSWFWQWDMGYDVEAYRDKATVEMYHQLSSNVHFNSVTENYIIQAQKAILPEADTVIGVNVRIGGYSAQSANQGEGHPVQPQIDQLISIVANKLMNGKNKRIFLASDTEFAVNKFQQAFGDKVILYPRLRTEIGKEFASDPQKQIYAPGKGYQTALDYLTEMEILSCCDSLIGTITSGFRYALVQNGNRFSDCNVLDLGKLPNNRAKGHKV